MCLCLENSTFTCTYMYIYMSKILPPISKMYNNPQTIVSAENTLRYIIHVHVVLIYFSPRGHSTGDVPEVGGVPQGRPALLQIHQNIQHGRVCRYVNGCWILNCHLYCIRSGENPTFCRFLSKLRFCST